MESRFLTFRAAMDAKQQTREQLMVSTRRATQLSKNAISDLHRQASLLHSDTVLEGNGAANADRISVPPTLLEARQELRKMYGVLAASSSGSVEQAYYLWSRTITAGLQEYIEACALQQFLEDFTLVTLARVCRDIASAEPDTSSTSNVEVGNEQHAPAAGQVFISPEDFLMGVLDLGGEVMRLCVNSAARGDFALARSSCEFLKSFHEAVAILPDRSPDTKELSGKKRTLLASVKKCEKILFDYAIRIAEFPDMDPHELAAHMARSSQRDSSVEQEGEDGR